MITYEDQMNIFGIISKKINQDIQCYAFGGTAMMFYGYKEETKDIDLLFEKDEERKDFTNVIEDMGFSKYNPFNLYVPEKLKNKYKPLVYDNGSIRFDLFLKKIFQTLLSDKMKDDLFAVHEFREKYNFKVNVLRKEHLVMLKAVTERKTDFDDILKIIQREKRFDWQYLIDEAIWQYRNGNEWILLDMEKMMLELKKYIFIEKKYLDQIYKLQK
ncbi:hypothetical protein HYX16_06335 [Candidatus Woesearchaeota archaeon]|nr:hypothetical protein [Candidatus Woesearchaeota archaeon]